MALKPTIGVLKVDLKNGSTLVILPKEKVVICGPNNSGKSTFLREIVDAIGKESDAHRKIVSKLSLEKKGDVSELREFLKRNATFKDEQYSY